MNERYTKTRDSAIVGILMTELEKAGIVIPQDVEERVYQIVKEFDGTTLGQLLEKLKEPS